MVDMPAPDSRQLYTPAMLAELLDVSVRMVRRWQRAGFLQPAAEVLHLPYFDYEGLATARQLAAWMRQGASVHSIQVQLESLRRRAGNFESLQQLPITAEGKRLVLRQGDQYLEASGQLRFGFESPIEDDDHSQQITLRFQPAGPQPPTSEDARQLADHPLSLDAMIEEAIAAEDDGDLELAIEWYRSALSAHGPNADICFQIAELLYRTGDITAARERYFVALELSPDLVEARANLGCVLAECGEVELAIAAFEGTLEQFADYADVHFHLAKALDESGESGKAAEHWRRFLELAPASPWAEEAQQRLHASTPLLDF